MLSALNIYSSCMYDIYLFMHLMYVTINVCLTLDNVSQLVHLTRPIVQLCILMANKNLES